jgi:hypothetical protein
VFTLCEDEFERTPGALQVLKSRFGERPSYHYTPSDDAADEVRSVDNSDDRVDVLDAPSF